MVLLWTFLCIHPRPQLGLFPWNKFLAVESPSLPSLSMSLLPGVELWCRGGRHRHLLREASYLPAPRGGLMWDVVHTTPLPAAPGARSSGPFVVMVVKSKTRW